MRWLLAPFTIPLGVIAWLRERNRSSDLDQVFRDVQLMMLHDSDYLQARWDEVTHDL